MPAGPFQNTIFGRKCPFYAAIRFNFAPKFASQDFLYSLFALQDFLPPIFARLIKRMGTAALDHGFSPLIQRLLLLQLFMKFIKTQTNQKEPILTTSEYFLSFPNGGRGESPRPCILSNELCQIKWSSQIIVGIYSRSKIK